MFKAFNIVAFFSLFCTYVLKAQIIKADLDSVIVYCKYNDLIKAIKKENHYSQSTHWEGKKKIVERDPSPYIDSLKLQKKISGDTITLSYIVWCDDLVDETNRLAEKYQLTYFDKRTNKLVTHIKKIVTGKKGRLLLNEYIDSDTKKKLYITTKKSWIKF